jgi:hypothetical protein
MMRLSNYIGTKLRFALCWLGLHPWRQSLPLKWVPPGWPDIFEFEVLFFCPHCHTRKIGMRGPEGAWELYLLPLACRTCGAGGEIAVRAGDTWTSGPCPTCNGLGTVDYRGGNNENEPLDSQGPGPAR